VYQIGLVSARSSRPAGKHTRVPMRLLDLHDRRLDPRSIGIFGRIVVILASSATVTSTTSVCPLNEKAVLQVAFGSSQGGHFFAHVRLHAAMPCHRESAKAKLRGRIK